MPWIKVLAPYAAPKPTPIHTWGIMLMNVKQRVNPIVHLSRRGFALSGLAAVLTFPTIARAADLLTFIVPFEAGSAPDLYARIVAPEIGKLLVRTVIVENKPGAG